MGQNRIIDTCIHEFSKHVAAPCLRSWTIDVDQIRNHKVQQFSHYLQTTCTAKHYYLVCKNIDWKFLNISLQEGVQI